MSVCEECKTCRDKELLWFSDDRDVRCARCLASWGVILDPDDDSGIFCWHERPVAAPFKRSIADFMAQLRRACDDGTKVEVSTFGGAKDVVVLHK